VALLPLTAAADYILAGDHEGLNGKTIRSIIVQVDEIFDEPNLGYLYRTANSLKVETREQIIRAELLFKEGDAYDSFVIAESERHLRNVGYLRRVNITPITVAYDEVDLLVRVQDTWTLILKTSFSSGDGRDRLRIGLAENNLLGYGQNLEFLYEKDDSRDTFELSYAIPALLGTRNDLAIALFSRSDGERVLFQAGAPFRSLVEKTSWGFDMDLADIIGRLYEDGDERFIFRENRRNFRADYALSHGSPEYHVRRYYLGFDLLDSDFSQAQQKDFDDLDLNPGELESDIRLVPEDRRFSGPSLRYQSVRPDYISMSYIDRFNRIQDYNLGEVFYFGAHLAPKALGSNVNALRLSASRVQGWKLSNSSFVKGELGVGTRAETDGFTDSLFRGEVRYYNVLGPQFAGGLFLGNHTLAFSMVADYGKDLDRDREFLMGADNFLRGYKARTFTGDKRFAVNLEDRVHLVDEVFRLISLGAAFFIDAGGASSRGFDDLFANRFYSNIGAGLRFSFPRSSVGRVIRLDVALPLRDGPDGSGRFEPRILFATGQLFSSNLSSELRNGERANWNIGKEYN
jgi:hypothetical protein